MTALVLTLTTAGYAALVNPANTGTNAIQVTQIGITATAFTPDPLLSALPGEIKRVTTFAGAVVADDTIHVTVSDSGTDTYSMRGFALYDQFGVMLALFGQAGVILEKSTQATMLLSADMRFMNPLEAEVIFGDSTFINPPATTTVPGVVQLADNAAGIDGLSAVLAVPPSVLKHVLDQRFGVGAPSAFVKALLPAANGAAFRSALDIKSAALKDEGAGNGLDADTVDGLHAAAFLQTTARGAVNGVAPLDSGGKVPAANLPSIAFVEVFTVASQAAQLALTVQRGDVAVRSDINKSYIHNGGTSATMADWTELRTPTDAVLSVAGRTGAVTLAISDIDGLLTALNLRAPLASPTLTGTPTAPTAAAGNNTTQLATTAFVQAAIAAAVATLLPKNNPTFTGTMTGPAYNEV
jgi:hypothetical protein